MNYKVRVKVSETTLQEFIVKDGMYPIFSRDGFVTFGRPGEYTHVFYNVISITAENAHPESSVPESLPPELKSHHLQTPDKTA